MTKYTHRKKDDPDPIDYLIEYLHKKELKGFNLIGIIGDKATVSKILNKKRKLTLEKVRMLYYNLEDINLEKLIEDYELNKDGDERYY